MPFMAQKNNVLGMYFGNSFCISMSSDVKIIDGVSNTIRFNSFRDYAVFIHEYWHYIVNISTIAGYMDLDLWISFLCIFSNTICDVNKGTVDPMRLSSKEKDSLVSLFNYYEVRAGDIRPSGFNSYVPVSSFSILDYNVTDEIILIDDRETTVSKIKISFSLDTALGKRDYEYYLGTYAIDEGLAYEMQNYAGQSKDNVPFFPYMVLRKFAQHVTGIELLPYELCAITTISLLSTNPTAMLVTLFEEYKSFFNKIPEVKKRLELIWAFSKPHISKAINIALSDIDEIQKLYVKRGFNVNDVSYFINQYKRYLKLRLEFPVFDIDCIFNINGITTAFNDLIKQLPPCTVIQEEPGDMDTICRDHMSSFGDQREMDKSSFNPFDFLRILQCQMHYLYAHYKNKNFIPTNEVTQVACPFYTICNTAYRAKNGEVCKTKPWEIINVSEGGKCWYGIAVNAVIGNVYIGKKENL